ncbi:hypothetical protein Tco_0493798 [Tanacetum coccineum]
MIELNSPKAKANLLQHVGVASWFSHIGNAQLDFAAKERIVWVDIEGVPLNAWSHPTFKKIGSIWGEMVDLEEENDNPICEKAWKGECLVMGDFNEVRSIDERWGSTFNKQGADLFNSFISSSGLIDIPKGRDTPSHGLTPRQDFKSWASFNLDDSNAMIRFKKKLKLLKVEIRKWTKDFKEKQEGQSRGLNLKLRDIDKTLDQGGVTDDLLLSRMELMKQIQDIHKSKHRDSMQRQKLLTPLGYKGDETLNIFSEINKKRANLSVKGVMVDGDWVVDPILVKKEFRDHFADRFQDPGPRKGMYQFQIPPNRLSSEQVADLETRISTDEIRSAVWGCGVDKSPDRTISFYGVKVAKEKNRLVQMEPSVLASKNYVGLVVQALISHFCCITILLGVLLIQRINALNDKLKLSFPRLFALEVNKDCSVADKLNALSQLLFVRQTLWSPESRAFEQLTNHLDSFLFRTWEDRVLLGLNGEGFSSFKDVRRF